MSAIGDESPPVHDVTEKQRHSKAQFGFWTGVAMVGSSMVGSGVFTTGGFLLADLGSAPLVLLAWLMGGAIALCGALCYAGLARDIPESGGEYIYLTRIAHPSLGFIAGWVSVFAGFSAPIAAAAFGFGEYLHGWIPGVDARLLGSLAILAVSSFHFFSSQKGAQFQNLAAYLKFFLIFLFIGWGFSQSGFQDSSLLQSMMANTTAEAKSAGFPWSVFAVSLVWIYYSYSGWNASVYLAEEFRDPKKDLPRSLMVGTLLITALYLGLNAVFMGAAPVADLAGRADIGNGAAEALGGKALAAGMTALIALALLTSVSSMALAGSRVLEKMAREGIIPALTHDQEPHPRRAIAAQSFLALILLWSASFQQLLTYIGFTLGLCTALTISCSWWRRVKDPTKSVPIRWTLLTFVFVFCILGSTFFAVQMRPMESAVGAMTLLAGWVVWAWKYRK